MSGIFKEHWFYYFQAFLLVVFLLMYDRPEMLTFPPSSNASHFKWSQKSLDIIFSFDFCSDFGTKVKQTALKNLKSAPSYTVDCFLFCLISHKIALYIQSY